MLYVILAIGYTAIWWLIGLIVRVDEPFEFALKAFWFSFIGVCVLFFVVILWVLIVG